MCHENRPRYATARRRVLDDPARDRVAFRRPGEHADETPPPGEFPRGYFARISVRTVYTHTHPPPRVLRVRK